jgi:outer membrane lipoprotein SlyB
MTLDFDSIRLRDGRSYQFAGLLDSAIARNGDSVRVDTEGAVRDSSQTTQTQQRAAIGAAVGAIIGAIAGGGKGAAIGALLGGGAGAGSVYVQGRNDLELERGSQFIIRAGAPYYGPR